MTVTPASIRDSGWNPRFVAYANAHGASAAELWERGGWSVDFMAWNTAQLREWRQLRSLGDRPLTLSQHDDYTSWLTRRHQTKVAA